MAVKFPRPEFAALGLSKVALDWLASLGGASTTVAAVDLTGLEAAIAAAQADATAAAAAADAAQTTADDASLLVPIIHFFPDEAAAALLTALLTEGGDALQDEAGDSLLIEA